MKTYDYRWRFKNCLPSMKVVLVLAVVTDAGRFTYCNSPSPLDMSTDDYFFLIDRRLIIAFFWHDLRRGYPLNLSI